MRNPITWIYLIPAKSENNVDALIDVATPSMSNTIPSLIISFSILTALFPILLPLYPETKGISF